MGHFRDRMEEDLRLAGYSPSTIKIYLIYARKYVEHHMRSPAEMGEKEIREFLLYLVEKRDISRATYRQVRAALIFLYRITLRRPTEVEHLPVRRKQKRLPVVLSGTEVSALLEAVEDAKYKAILMGIYSAGLRISEACRLRAEDIDSKRMVVRVRAGKGGRDRYTVLSARFLKFLRTYWKARRPKSWLFPGRTVAGHASPNTARKVFQKALAATGIGKPVTPHSLRHCFATHLLESGADVAVIQALLGHGSLRATQTYTHVSTAHIGRVKSPLDILETPEAARLG